MHRFTVYFVITLICVSCLSTPSATPGVKTEAPFGLTSSAFAAGQAIPVIYSCKDRNISPPLSWTEPPANTKSFALIMDDPDAHSGAWTHWLLFNIPAATRSLQEDLPVTGKNTDPNSIYVGNNSSGNAAYYGPCPPSGTHHYSFRLYALDAPISLLPGATKDEVMKEMKSHILGQTELIGTFSH